MVTKFCLLFHSYDQNTNKLKGSETIRPSAPATGGGIFTVVCFNTVVSRKKNNMVYFGLLWFNFNHWFLRKNSNY